MEQTSVNLDHELSFLICFVQVPESLLFDTLLEGGRDNPALAEMLLTQGYITSMSKGLESSISLPSFSPGSLWGGFFSSLSPSLPLPLYLSAHSAICPRSNPCGCATGSV